MLRAAASVVGLCAVFVAVMYFAYSGDTVPAPDGTATPSEGVHSTPEASPIGDTPEIFAGMKVVPLEVGTPWDLPADIALILETGCYGCSGGPSGLVRVFVSPDGSVVHEPLIDHEALGIPPQLGTAPDGTVYELRTPLTGYAIRPDGSRIVASLCARGPCGLGGERYQWSASSQTAIFSSSDGGISWTETGRLDVGAEVVALFPDDRVLIATFPEELKTEFRVFPDLSVIEAPGSEYWGAEVLPNSELVWFSDGRTWVSPGGHPLLTSPSGIAQPRPNAVLIDPKQMDGLASVYDIYRSPTGSLGRHYLVPFDHAGAVGQGSFARVGDSVVWSNGPVELGVELTKEGLILANASVATDEISPSGVPLVFDHDPVVIDLTRGTLSVIRLFAGTGIPKSRNIVVAVQRGPFARVVNTGSCLNIRAEPSSSAASLDCAADGVLLRDIDLMGRSDWIEVVTPSGIAGWASTEYLERRRLIANH